MGIGISAYALQADIEGEVGEGRFSQLSVGIESGSLSFLRRHARKVSIPANNSKKVVRVSGHSNANTKVACPLAGLTPPPHTGRFMSPGLESAVPIDNYELDCDNLESSAF